MCESESLTVSRWDRVGTTQREVSPDPGDQLHCVRVVDLLQLRQLSQHPGEVLPPPRADKRIRGEGETVALTPLTRCTCCRARKLTSLHRLKPMMVGTAVLKIKAWRERREYINDQIMRQGLGLNRGSCKTSL